jgi:hypothetical protein
MASKMLLFAARDRLFLLNGSTTKAQGLSPRSQSGLARAEPQKATSGKPRYSCSHQLPVVVNTLLPLLSLTPGHFSPGVLLLGCDHHLLVVLPGLLLLTTTPSSQIHQHLRLIFNPVRFPCPGRSPYLFQTALGRVLPWAPRPVSNLHTGSCSVKQYRRSCQAARLGTAL